jgi:hypothetical protein
VRVSDEIGFDFVSSDALLSMALITAADGNPTEAVGFTIEAARRGEKADSPLAVARARLGEGLVLLGAGEVEAAEEALNEARRQGVEMSIGYMVTEADAALARIALGRGDLERAGSLVAGLKVGRVQLEGCLDPAMVYLAGIEVLDRVDPGAAAEVRSEAAEYLEWVSSSIGDDDSDLRVGFLGTSSNTELRRAIGAISFT